MKRREGYGGKGRSRPRMVSDDFHVVITMAMDMNRQKLYKARDLVRRCLEHLVGGDPAFVEEVRRAIASWDSREEQDTVEDRRRPDVKTISDALHAEAPHAMELFYQRYPELREDPE
jgi:hypothetical protein